MDFKPEIMIHLLCNQKKENIYFGLAKVSLIDNIILHLNGE